MKLLVGTHNEGKFVEISEALGALPMQLLRPRDIGLHEIPEETGATFLENALEKARYYAGLSRLPTIADDSGVIVEALGDELGLHTRRWGAGPDASDKEWIEFFLKRMKKERNKRACFTCSLAHIDEAGKIHTFEGRCEGKITEALEADFLPGLPISACFRPDGCACVFSALSVEQKNSTSHRGRALEGFRLFLQRNKLAVDPGEVPDEH